MIFNCLNFNSRLRSWWSTSVGWNVNMKRRRLKLRRSECEKPEKQLRKLARYSAIWLLSRAVIQLNIFSQLIAEFKSINRWLKVIKSWPRNLIEQLTTGFHIRHEFLLCDTMLTWYILLSCVRPSVHPLLKHLKWDCGWCYFTIFSVLFWHVAKTSFPNWSFSQKIVSPVTVKFALWYSLMNLTIVRSSWITMQNILS